MDVITLTPGDTYTWVAIYADQDFLAEHDVRYGEQGWANVDQTRLAGGKIAIIDRLQTDRGLVVDVPEGCVGVFTRRRTVAVLGSQPGLRSTTTILGYRRPDGSGEYHFVNAAGDVVVLDDFQWNFAEE